MRAAEALLDMLASSGNPVMFGLPGSTDAPVLDAFVSRPGLRYVLGLHESVVVAMADGYARGTGRPALANLHTTVGTGNALTGLFNAFKDRSPVVALATHKHSAILGRDGFCVGPDLAAWAAPVTKWAWQGVRAEQICDDAARALKVAGTAPMGPVFLCYPEDLLGAEVRDSRPDAGHEPLADASPSAQQIAAIENMWFEAARPVLIAGDEVSSTAAVEVLLRVAERHGTPILQEDRRSAVTWNVPADHPLYAGMYSPQHPLLAASDLVIGLGCRLALEFSPSRKPAVPENAALIHVHRDPWEVGKLYAAGLGVVASTRLVLEALWESCKQHPAKSPGLVPQPARRAATSRAGGEDHDGPVSPAGLAQHLASVAPRETVIVDEAVRSSRALLEHYPCRPGQYFHSSGGGLGWGLPAALGVQMATPGRPVVAYVGDGSLMFAVQALWTAVREQLPVKVIVCNNKQYLAVKAGLLEYGSEAVARGVFPGVSLAGPDIDFVALAGSFGIPGRKISDPLALGDALQWAFKADGPVLLDVPITQQI